MAKHLTEKQRIELETLYRLGYSRRKMAAFLNCSIRTVYYELSRGKCEQIDGKTWRTYHTYSQRPIDVFTKELKIIGLDCSVLQNLF